MVARVLTARSTQLISRTEGHVCACHERCHNGRALLLAMRYHRSHLTIAWLLVFSMRFLDRYFTQEKMKQFDACLIDCLPQKMCLVERCAAPCSGSHWIKLLNQPVLKIVAVSPCPTNCATRAKHQILTSPCKESNVVELENQHLT